MVRLLCKQGGVEAMNESNFPVGDLVNAGDVGDVEVLEADSGARYDSPQPGNPLFSPLASSTQSRNEDRRVAYLNSAVGNDYDKIHSFMRFVRRQDFAKLLAFQELFTKTSGVVGDIADCGVFFGQGLMTYAHLAVCLEPYNYQCRIVGFDTFDGDTDLVEEDKGNELVNRQDFNYKADALEDLEECITIFDNDRPLNHLRKIELVKGDLCQTAPDYIKARPESLFRILHLSVNLYQPTLSALRAFGPRVSEGGIIAVHGLNVSAVGAQRALLEYLAEAGVTRPAIKTIPYYPNVCYVMV